MKKPYMYKAWLENQYRSLEKSTYKIANEYGCSQTTIRNWIHKLEILIRSKSEAQCIAQSNHVSLTSEALEYLSGELLGDGYLDHFTRWSSSYFHSSKYRGYLEWLSKKLAGFGIEQAGKIYRHVARFKGSPKRYIGFDYNSRRYVELKGVWAQWYRPATGGEEGQRGRKFIKIIPPDLILTPLVCMMWYLGDGSLSKKSGYITLSTQCFFSKEVDFLIDLLRNFGFKATKSKVMEIRISTKSTSAFLDFIGPCPKEIKSLYGYKWGAVLVGSEVS